MLGGDRGHGGLRPITARHAEGVCAVPHGRGRQRREVVAWFEHDRLDAARLALRDEVESSRFPPARARIDDQDRRGGTRHWR